MSRTGLALIANISVAAGLSLLVPLLALNLEVHGESKLTIGLLGSTTGLGIIFAPFLFSFLVQKFIIRHIIIAAFATAIITTILHKLFFNVQLWFFLRFLSATAFTMVFIIIDHWMTKSYKNNRSLYILGFYAVTFSIGYALGPVILSIFDIYSWSPYLMILFLCCIPVAFLFLPVHAQAVDLQHRSTKSQKIFLKLFWVSPLAFFAAFLTGAMEVSMADLLPILGRMLEMSTRQSALLLSFFSLGGIFTQLIMIGIFRRIPHQKSILITGWAISICTLLLAFVFNSWLLYAIIPLSSGFMLILFPIGLALLSDDFSSYELLHANALFGLCYGCGGLIGPVWIGFMMHYLSTSGFILGILTLALFFLIAVYHSRWRINNHHSLS